MVTFVKAADGELLRQLSVLADEIWHEHFIDIIGKAQTDYMVEKFQSYEAMEEQIRTKNYSYYAMLENNEMIGYFAIMPDGDKLFLSKLYIHNAHRGKHYASRAFEFMRDYCLKNGFNAIWLTVNRHNDNTIKVYLKKGFEIIREQKTDIGNGFVMDDYIMEMKVQNA